MPREASEKDGVLKLGPLQLALVFFEVSGQWVGPGLTPLWSACPRSLHLLLQGHQILEV